MSAEPDRIDDRTDDRTPDQGALDLAGGFEVVEAELLGEEPSLTRVQVAEQAGVPLATATELWRLMGFASTDDDEVAFSHADVEALRTSQRLIDLGVLGPERQAALVRTWGRSFARLAEWQSSLLTSLALESDDPAATLAQLTGEVLPAVDQLQSYVWRRHLVSAGGRLLAVADPTSPVVESAVVFADIVGYTSRSKTLDEAELVAWIEGFEAQTLDLVSARGGRIIKNIGDEVLFVTDGPDAVANAVEIALEMTRRGEDDDDPFPAVRVGVAFGEVVSRLGDVFGPTVNIAARLTSVARPGTVLLDRGAHDLLTGTDDREEHREDDEPERPDQSTPYRLRRVRRVSVKGYSRLAAWVVRSRD